MGFSSLLGLTGSRYRASALLEAERLIEDAVMPVTPHLVWPAARLALREHVDGPMDRWDSPNEAQRQLLIEEGNRRQALIQTLVKHYLERLTVTVDGKIGEAHDVSLKTLVEMSEARRRASFVWSHPAAGECDRPRAVTLAVPSLM